jgi:hypothetical protein
MLGIPYQTIFSHSEFCNFVLNHSAGDKNAPINSVPSHFGHSELRNFVLNHSAEDKNAPYSVPIHFVKEKNTWELCYFVLNHLAKEKTFGNSF